MTSPTIYIRADANPAIGVGHIMRCLPIGEDIRSQGGCVRFLTADAEAKELVESNSFEAICLNSSWNDLERELPQLISLIQENDTSVLLVDSYAVTPHYLATLRQYTKLAYIDDVNAFPYPVDLLICYALYSRPEDYEPHTDKTQGHIPPVGGQPGARRPQLLLGSDYIPLKKDFRNLPRRTVSRYIPNILILTGGSDPCHVALQLAEQIVHAEDWRKPLFHIVRGKYNSDYDRLCFLASRAANLRIHYDVEDMRALMLQADLAITAGGTTTYELCACGTPSTCYILADNQIQNAQSLTEKGFMLFGEDVRIDEGIARIMRQLKHLAVNAALRTEMAEIMQRLVDGKGAGRIAQAILEMHGAECFSKKEKEKRD